jgi:hypothetical protein
VKGETDMSIGQFIELVTSIFPILVEFFTKVFGGKEDENADA